MLKKVWQAMKAASIVRLPGGKTMNVYVYGAYCTVIIGAIFSFLGWTCRKLEERQIRREDAVNRAAMDLISRANEVVLKEMDDCDPIKTLHVQMGVSQEIGSFFNKFK